MAEEKKTMQDEAPESRNFIHAFIEEDIGPGGHGGVPNTCKSNEGSNTRVAYG